MGWRTNTCGVMLCTAVTLSFSCCTECKSSPEAEDLQGGGAAASGCMVPAWAILGCMGLPQICTYSCGTSWHSQRCDMRSWLAGWWRQESL